MLRFSRTVATIIEYGMLCAIMTVSISSAMTLVRTNLNGPFGVLAAVFEQPGHVLKIAPAASSPAVSAGVRAPRDFYSILPLADLLR